jgi:hypothetical protein
VRRLMANPREMEDVLTVWFSLVGQPGGQP